MVVELIYKSRERAASAFVLLKMWWKSIAYEATNLSKGPRPSIHETRDELRMRYGEEGCELRRVGRSIIIAEEVPRDVVSWEEELFSGYGELPHVGIFDVIFSKESMEIHLYPSSGPIRSKVLGYLDRDENLLEGLEKVVVKLG